MPYVIATPTTRRRKFLTGKPSWVTPNHARVASMLGQTRTKPEGRIMLFADHRSALLHAYSLASEEDEVCGHRYVIFLLSVQPPPLAEVAAGLGIDLATLSIGQRAALARMAAEADTGVRIGSTIH